MKKWVVFVGILSVLTLALSGCTYYRPYQGVPLASLDGVEVVGTTEGEACRNFFLCIPVGGENTLKEAIDDALSRIGGDSLINYTVDIKTGTFPIIPIFFKRCTIVKGTAVRFKK